MSTGFKYDRSRQRLKQALFAVGSASSPAIIGAGVTNTGWYWTTAPALAASVGGTRAAFLDATNQFIGVSAGAAITSGVNNVFIGENAARLITVGSNNVFIGYRAGLNTDTTNINNNVVIGALAGQNLEDGNGVSSGGFQEVLIGQNSGNAITTGPNNTMVGDNCGKSTTSGGSNCFYGRASFNDNTTGGFNVGLGHATGFDYTEGDSNTFVGNQAGNPTIGGNPARTGDLNVAVGELSGPTLETASNTICIGSNVTVATSNTGRIGDDNITALTLSGDITTTAAGATGHITAVGKIAKSSTNGQESQILHATTLLSALSGATVTATNLIPAGSLVLGVTARVTTAIGGATSFEIGDGTDVDRWGTAIAVAAGTTTDIANFTIASPVNYTAANNVVLTANGSNFTSGAVRLTVHYIDLVAATS